METKMICCLAALLALAGCQTLPAADTTACHLPAEGETARMVDGFAAPESVLVAGSRVFVSNIGAKLDPSAKDGDGFISELDRAGRMVARKAFPRNGGEPLHAPKGLALAGVRLYVADVDRVVGFKISSGAQVFEARTAGNAGQLHSGDAQTVFPPHGALKPSSHHPLERHTRTT